MIKYNFVALKDLETLPKDSTCGVCRFVLHCCNLSNLNSGGPDVIGVVKDVSPVSEITSRAQNKIVRDMLFSS